MSTFKVDTINNDGTNAIDATNGFTIAGNSIVQGYTSSASEPSSPSTGDLWWDSTNEVLKRYINSEWKELSFAEAAALWYGDRAVVAGGGDSGSNVIEYFNITSTGNSSDFGDLTAAKLQFGASGVSNATYGVFGGGGNAYNVANNVMEYVTISTTGNATDFGDRTVSSGFTGSASDATYGLFAGGYTGSATSTIDYITIATTGNSTDFGDLTNSRWGVAGSNDATRGVFSMGNSPDNVIDYVTIASTGNAVDFGDLTEARMRGGATGNGTYVVFVGGCLSGANNNPKNTMDYITVQTTGNATDYGDLTSTAANLSCTGNGSRGVRCGGENTSAQNIIDSFTIATTANAADFGDLLTAKAHLTATSGNAS
jgi:hypothetical protein